MQNGWRVLAKVSLLNQRQGERSSNQLATGIPTDLLVITKTASFIAGGLPPAEFLGIERGLSQNEEYCALTRCECSQLSVIDRAPTNNS